MLLIVQVLLVGIVDDYPSRNSYRAQEILSTDRLTDHFRSVMLSSSRRRHDISTFSLPILLSPQYVGIWASRLADKQCIHVVLFLVAQSVSSHLFTELRIFTAPNKSRESKLCGRSLSNASLSDPVTT